MAVARSHQAASHPIQAIDRASRARGLDRPSSRPTSRPTSRPQSRGGDGEDGSAAPGSSLTETPRTPHTNQAPRSSLLRLPGVVQRASVRSLGQAATALRSTREPRPAEPHRMSMGVSKASSSSADLTAGEQPPEPPGYLIKADARWKEKWDLFVLGLVIVTAFTIPMDLRRWSGRARRFAHVRFLVELPAFADVGGIYGQHDRAICVYLATLWK